MNNRTTADILTDYANAKTAIANAITAKGGSVNEGDGFAEFATDIGSIVNEEDGISKLFRQEITNYTTSYFKNVVTLPPYTFITCSNTIKSVSLSDSVKTIDHHSFYDGTIESINLNHGLETINYSCFCFLTVSELIFPATLKNIGNGVFAGSRISTFIFLSPVPPTFNGAFNTSTTQVIYVPAESVNAYKTATNWSDYASLIQAIPSEEV